MGAIAFDAVKHLVLCRVEKNPPKLDLDVDPYLPKANVSKTSAMTPTPTGSFMKRAFYSSRSERERKSDTGLTR